MRGECTMRGPCARVTAVFSARSPVYAVACQPASPSSLPIATISSCVPGRGSSGPPCNGRPARRGGGIKLCAVARPSRSAPCPLHLRCAARWAALLRSNAGFPTSRRTCPAAPRRAKQVFCTVDDAQLEFLHQQLAGAVRHQTDRNRIERPIRSDIDARDSVQRRLQRLPEGCVGRTRAINSALAAGRGC